MMSRVRAPPESLQGEWLPWSCCNYARTGVEDDKAGGPHASRRRAKGEQQRRRGTCVQSFPRACLEPGKGALLTLDSPRLNLHWPQVRLR